MSNVAELGKIRKRKRGHLKGRQIDDQALAEVQALLGEDPRQADMLIEYLHRIQDTYKYISATHMVALAHEMKLSMTEVYEVATFYHHFDVIKDDDTPPPALTVRVCDSITCEMFGANKLISELEQKLEPGVRVQRVPCVGRCAGAPVAVVGTNPIEQATLANTLSAVEQKAVDEQPGAYTNYQAYVADGGYKLYQDCMAGNHDVETIVKTLQDSKLRGLGGAGFPAGKKWEILRQQAKPRLIAINIDEGEPGTFKDRYFLERDPHRFIEGGLIAAWAIESDAIYIYLRDEYAGCRKILERELEALKKDPPGGVTLPQLHLRRGAGAYICGEESAMIESIEGKRGMPRLRPPYVAQVGLFGCPTLEHNMETLHWVRDIIEKGANWFASQGRNGRYGLRSFSVSGRVKKPGVHLAPAGITLRELIDEYCGDRKSVV